MTVNENQLESWESNLRTVWKGQPQLLEFTYTKYSGDKREKQRRKVDVFEVLINPDKKYYLKGFCRHSKEVKHFKEQNIETMLLHKSKRMEVAEWLEGRVGKLEGYLGEVYSDDLSGEDDSQDKPSQSSKNSPTSVLVKAMKTLTVICILIICGIVFVI